MDGFAWYCLSIGYIFLAIVPCFCLMSLSNVDEHTPEDILCIHSEELLITQCNDVVPVRTHKELGFVWRTALYDEKDDAKRCAWTAGTSRCHLFFDAPAPAISRHNANFPDWLLPDNVKNIPDNDTQMTVLARMVPIKHTKEDATYLGDSASVTEALAAVRADARPVVQMALRINWSRLMSEWQKRHTLKNVSLPEGWSEYWGCGGP